jgi:hypothetical protein
MESLFIVSTESFCGKTAFIAGLMIHLRRDGLEPGYMKPVSSSPRAVGSDLIDLDAQFIKNTFDLEPSLDQLVPVLLTDSVVDRELRGKGTLLTQVKAAYDELTSGVRVLLLEGAGDLSQGALLGLSAAGIAEILDLPALVVTPYTDRLTGDDLLLAARVLGKRMIGAVVNGVPDHEMELFEDRIVPVLETRGVPVMGVIPHRRLLGAATVGELAEQIGGEFLIGEEHTDELVETLCIGAMSIDHVLTHFRRKRNKVVIAEGARSDIQLAALETSSRCLILTGNLRPKPAILARAEEQGVPVVLSKHSTLETVEMINEYFGRARFHQPEKFDEFREVLEANLDFDRLYQTLGWKGQV